MPESRTSRETLELVRGDDRAPFDEEGAFAAGLLATGYSLSAGLSLGDRACVALALRTGLPALTGDRAWRDIASILDVEVEIFR